MKTLSLLAILGFFAAVNVSADETVTTGNDEASMQDFRGGNGHNGHDGRGHDGRGHDGRGHNHPRPFPGNGGNGPDKFPYPTSHYKVCFARNRAGTTFRVGGYGSASTVQWYAVNYCRNHSRHPNSCVALGCRF